MRAAAPQPVAQSSEQPARPPAAVLPDGARPLERQASERRLVAKPPERRLPEALPAAWRPAERRALPLGSGADLRDSLQAQQVHLAGVPPAMAAAAAAQQEPPVARSAQLLALQAHPACAAVSPVRLDGHSAPAERRAAVAAVRLEAVAYQEAAPVEAEPRRLADLAGRADPGVEAALARAAPASVAASAAALHPVPHSVAHSVAHLVPHLERPLAPAPAGRRASAYAAAAA